MRNLQKSNFTTGRLYGHTQAPGTASATSAAVHGEILGGPVQW